MSTRALYARGGRPAVPAVLNPRLYALLTQTCGRVTVGNPGEAATPAAAQYDRSAGVLRAAFAHLGEYYRLICPYCNDTRSRLWVNHLWCTPDPLTGEPMRHLAVCYNADCLKDHYGAFEERVFGWRNASARQVMCGLRVRPGRVLEPGPVRLPGACVRLDELPRDHPACVYLEDRGFDPAALARDWGVAYCAAGGEFPAAEGRVIAPVEFRAELVGWQGRWPAELRWRDAGRPKYYTMPGFAKGRVLYGYDAAARARPRLVLVVEGVTDVWAAGPGAVATLGKSLGAAQQAILAEWAARDALLLLCYDPGAWTTEAPDRARAQAKRAELLTRLGRDFGPRLVEVALPPGRDPASFCRRALWEVLDGQARAAGFRLKDYL